MPSKLIISVSGVRGIVGGSLTEDVAMRFAAALGTHTQGGTVVLARDGRTTGDLLRHAALAGLLSTGCTIHDIGVAPTPTCGLAVRRLNADGALQITASHNPAQWNGLKIFGPDGRVVNAEQGEHIRDRFEKNEFERKPWNEIGASAACTEAPNWHIETVLPLLYADRIRKRRFRILVDANGGAGGPLACALLHQLQCDVVPLGCEADGHFAHPPEPVAEHLSDVLPTVTENNVDAAFVLDPDADRLAIIDETGRYIGEELTLALAVKLRLQQQKGPVVINMSTSRIVEDIVKSFGVQCHRSAVGEANVADEMQRIGAVIGGEGNGGVIDPRVGYVRDPFIGMGQILDLMSQTDQPLSTMIADLPTYHIVKEKYEIDTGNLDAILAKLVERYPDATPNHKDGLRLDWPNHWVHIRPSNTEPVVRVIAEAPERETAEGLCGKVREVLG